MKQIQEIKIAFLLFLLSVIVVTSLCVILENILTS